MELNCTSFFPVPTSKSAFFPVIPVGISRMMLTGNKITSANQSRHRLIPAAGFAIICIVTGTACF
jgi:hypothetical protein